MLKQKEYRRRSDSVSGQKQENGSLLRQRKKRSGCRRPTIYAGLQKVGLTASQQVQEHRASYGWANRAVDPPSTRTTKEIRTGECLHVLST
ncbi:MAG: hypothetical protein ACLUVD_07595 [Mediterraneibacter faecis]